MIIHYIAFVTVLFSLVFSSFAMTPGGTQKKFIGLCFDTMFNTPSNVLAHAKELNGVPWLDGLAISLKDIVISLEGGGVVTSDTWRVMQHGHKWSRESIAPQLAYCREIVKYPALKDSFLLVWITPSGKKNRIAWNDDEGWKLFTENMRNLAWFAKESGFKGLMLDPEEYALALQYLYKKEDADSFEKCSALARQRGRQLFSAIFEEFPDIDLFFLWTLEHHVRFFSGRGETDPKQISDDNGELLPYFYNGMLDVMPPKARFVDGSEHYTLTATQGMWMKGALNQFVGAKPFVAPENWAKYRSQLLVSNAHYLDMYSQKASPKSTWYFGPAEGSRIEHFRLNLEESLLVADEYVWIYAESGRLIDWKACPTKYQSSKIPLWEDQIPGFTDLMVMAKDPDKLMAAKMEEKRRKGELKNLFEGQVALPRRFEIKEESVHTECKNPPSVKGVRPGEIYSVSFRYQAKVRSGKPNFKVVWRKDGRMVKEARNVELVDDPNQKPDTWRWVRTSVTVPEDVDELVVAIAGELSPGDSLSVNSINVSLVAASPEVKAEWNAKGKPPVFSSRAASSKRKWIYDESKKRLTDGNWTLSATVPRVDKSGSTLEVDGRNATGAGVLDFRNLQADTGMKAVVIGGFDKNQSITGLIAPDVKKVRLNGFRLCNCLKSAEISPDFEELSMGAFAWSTNLVEFSPRVFTQKARFGLSAFAGCSRLSGDFFYEGTNAISSSLFSRTAINSFRAPRSEILPDYAFSNTPHLKYISFAEEKRFFSEEERVEYLTSYMRKAGALRNLLPSNRTSAQLSSPKQISVCVEPIPRVKGVKPGELYSVAASMKATAYGSIPEFVVKWRKNGKMPSKWVLQRAFSMNGPRENGVWRTGSMLIRVPAGMDELEFHVTVAGLSVGESYEFDKFELYKLAEPPPVWPSETEREKE
jgi:hypothetical protein